MFTGIGTHLTNDVGLTALNIVIKLFACKLDQNDRPYYAVKLSDDTGKHMGDLDEVKTCKDTLKLSNHRTTCKIAKR